VAAGGAAVVPGGNAATLPDCACAARAVPANKVKLSTVVLAKLDIGFLRRFHLAGK
jgi:hypothetical protein